MTQLQWLLPYLLPPLLGAFIGYVTNYIAIRMLFRPLRAWRIFGIRIPLTPGVLPSRRAQFAGTIGKMVGGHLWTSEDVGQALEKKSFRKALKWAVSEKVGNILDRDLGTVESLLPPDFRRWLLELAEIVRRTAEEELFDYLQSPSFEGRFREFLQEWEDMFLRRDLESFLTPEHYRAIRDHFDERIGAFLRSEEVSGAVAAFLDEKIDKMLNSSRPIGEFIPEDLLNFIFEQVEKEVPPLLERFGGMLYDPAFRDRLVTKIKDWIEEFLDTLHGLAGLLSGLVNLDKIHEKIPDFLDRASDEIAKWLREERTQKQVAQILVGRIEDLLGRSLGSYLEKVPFEKVAEFRRVVDRNAVELLHSQRTVDQVVAAVEQGIDKLKDVPFRVFLEKTLPAEGVEQAREALCTNLLRALRSPDVRQVVSAVFREKVAEWLFRRPVGRLSARVPADALEELEEVLFRQLAEVLRSEIPPLIETLNVRKMVEDKVNALDILKVEGLLLGIMQEHFVYINMFGALLGFFLGTLNIFW